MSERTSIPALDSLGEDGLMTFWYVYQRSGPKLARHLFGEKFAGYTNAASSLAGYASNRATAMACARRGDKQAAELYDSIADGIAKRLPAQARHVSLPPQTIEAIRDHKRGERYPTVKAILRELRRRA